MKTSTRASGLAAAVCVAAVGFGVGIATPAHANQSCILAQSTNVYVAADPNSAVVGYLAQGWSWEWQGGINQGPDGKTYLYGVPTGGGSIGWVAKSAFYNCG
ncbi:hypothetical protein ABQE45_18090 [Mycobacteroides chelonae]